MNNPAAQLLSKVAAGILGLIMLILGCAYTPEVTLWAATYSYTWVMVGFFFYMMIAGLLLSTGCSAVAQKLTKKEQ